MRFGITPRLHRTTALLAPFVICGLLGQTPHAARAEDAPAATGSVRVSPGDVVFSISPAGSWKFATRTGRSLVEQGTLTVFTTGEDEKLTERLNSAAGTQSLLPPGGVAIVQEGAPGGARRPSSRADDDNDGKIDEDPLDRVDNDHDGRIDEDFAAIGDAMAVVKYATPGGVVMVRQEAYAWSLAHIDHMVASTCFIRNTGHEVLSGVRVGVTLVPGEAIAGNRLLAKSRQSSSVDFGTVSVMLRGNDESLTMLLMAKQRDGDTEEWNIRDDGETVFALSPPLGDLAPGEVLRLHMALVVSTPDETQTTRAIQAARRTLFGDGLTRMIPPPVSLTPRDDTATLGDEPDATPGVDAYWLRAGKLDETLLGGSPNPFRDAITIDYEVPSRVVDEDGIEHTLNDASLTTSVKVYNVTGRLIATLVDNPHAPGRYRTGWTAQSDTGGAVASGVYYVKLSIGKRSVTKRLVQLK